MRLIRMAYQKIMDASLDDEDNIMVKTAKGIRLKLNRGDIKQAKEDIGYSRPIKTHGQRMMFCSALKYQIIDISNLGGREGRPLKKKMKEAREMAKTKKVEWKFDGNMKNIDEIYVILTNVRAELKGDSKAFKGFTQAKKGEGEDKTKELTIMANFDKDFVEKEAFGDMCVAILEAMLKAMPDLTVTSFEVKE